MHAARADASGRRPRWLHLPWALAQAAASWVRIAWWGLVRPRTPLEQGPLVLVQAVILGREGVLLGLREDLRGWELPGGTLEPGETPEAALRREVGEETGLAVTVERHVGDWIRTGFRPHTARVYTCRLAEGSDGRAPVPGDEVMALQWHSPEAPPETLFDWYREPLARALAAGDAVVVRERWGWSAIWHGMRIDLRMRLRTDAPV